MGALEFILIFAAGWLFWRAWRGLRSSGSRAVRQASKSNVQRFDAARDAAGLGREWRKMNAFHQSIVGEQHYVAAHDSFLAGVDGRVEIEREPANEHDPSALAVIGVCQRDGAEWRGKLGYLPKAVAAEIAATRPGDLDVRAAPVSAYTARDGYRNLKIDLYEPSVSSGYWRARGIEPPGKLRAT